MLWNEHRCSTHFQLSVLHTRYVNPFFYNKNELGQPKRNWIDIPIPLTKRNDLPTKEHNRLTGPYRRNYTLYYRNKFNCYVPYVDDKKRSDIASMKFEEYGKSNKNFRQARLELRNIRQKIDHTNKNNNALGFISRLRRQAAQCDFRRTKNKEEAICELNEWILSGTMYPEVQKELPAEDKKNDTRKKKSQTKNYAIDTKSKTKTQRFSRWKVILFFLPFIQY